MICRVTVFVVVGLLTLLMAGIAVALPRLSYGDANYYARTALHRNFKGSFDAGYAKKVKCSRRLGYQAGSVLTSVGSWAISRSTVGFVSGSIGREAISGGTTPTQSPELTSTALPQVARIALRPFTRVSHRGTAEPVPRA